jgi:SAM-dependent methyltransferase
MAISWGVDERQRQDADRARSLIESRRCDPALFRTLLAGVPPAARDAWVDRVLGLDAIPEDGPALPRGCVPYLPCSVDTLLRLTAQAPMGASEVFVDVGSGVGRAAALVHLLTGASAVGVEVQPALVSAARALAARLRLSRLAFVEGDAAELAPALAAGSVFLLYCPFSGDRLVKLLADLEPVARAREIHLCCVDLPLPPRRWLEPVPPAAHDLAIYRSTPAT